MSGWKCQWGGCEKAATDKLIMVGVSGAPTGWYCAEHAAVHVDAGAATTDRRSA